MNIIIANAVADPDRNPNAFQVATNRLYYRPGWSSIEPKNTNADSIGLIATRGYYSSIKPAIGSILLNVNNITGAFYKAQHLHLYFKSYVDKFSGFVGADTMRPRNLEALKRH